jgi:N-acetylmuramoyl-L-alanine amidase
MLLHYCPVPRVVHARNTFELEQIVLRAACMSHIVIDPGHGGHDARGHSTPYGDRTSGLWEKDLNLRLAQRVAAHLGHGAVLTRSQDQNMSLQERADVARRLGARAFISLHGHSDRPGAEVYVHSHAGAQSRALADAVQREISYGNGCHCATASRELAVLNPAAIGQSTAAVMIECGYDGEIATGQPGAIDRLGASIARGVRSFLGSGDMMSVPQASRAPIVTHALTMEINAACDVCLPVVNAAGFPANQTNRLRCLLQWVRNTSVDDRYVNGYDYLLRTLGPRLNDEQLRVYLDSNHVRADIISAAERSDPRTDMDLLDKRIMQGIAWLNMQMHTQGAALPEAVLQIKDWVVERQRDRNSVYWCYGEGQDASYGGVYGGAPRRRRDSRSANG